MLACPLPCFFSCNVNIGVLLVSGFLQVKDIINMGARGSSVGQDLVVYGALRSGSTLLRLMIDAHPSLYCNGEHDYLFDHVSFDRTVNRWVLDRKQLLTDRIFLNHGLACPETTDAKAAVEDLLEQLSRKSGGKLVIMIHRNLDAAISLLNNPLIVHLIRDPRDVAASSIGMGWAGNVYYGVDHWIATEKEWARTSPRAPGSAVLTLRFERLIADPNSELSDLCGFYGVEFTPLMLEYHRSTTYEPVDPRLASQWKTKRTNKEIALIELRVGAFLGASGFKPSNVEPIKLSRLNILNLWFNNKAYIWRMRIERFGVIDSMSVAVARRLGVEAWAKPAMLRINARTKRYLK